MLTIEKRTTVNAISKTENGEIIATMNWSINERGVISSSENISNKELYSTNKQMVREDIDEFKVYCRELEDNEEVTNESEA